MKKSKVLLLLLCTVALSMAAAFGTLAYLTDSEAVTNTFTVGRVGISLDEADVDDTDKDDNTTERDTTNEYHLIPGKTYDKDPTVHVDSDSENCYVYVTVDNQIAPIEATDLTVAGQMGTNGWKVLKDDSNADVKRGELTVYFYDGTKATDGAVAKSTDLVVFEQFKIAGSGVSNDVIAAHANSKIVVTAYAIQADGFSSAYAAWNAANGELS